MPDERRRSRASQEAVLRSCAELIRRHGPGAVTIEGVAREAGVGKQTIYRWWRSREALLVDAMVAGREQADLAMPDTGDLEADLRAVLTAVVRVLRGEQGPALAGVLGQMQHDRTLRAAFDAAVFEPVRVRYRARLRSARAQAPDASRWPDDDTILDMAFGPVWFRLLTRPATLDEHLAAEVAAAVAGHLGEAGSDRSR